MLAFTFYLDDPPPQPLKKSSANTRSRQKTSANAKAAAKTNAKKKAAASVPLLDTSKTAISGPPVDQTASLSGTSKL